MLKNYYEIERREINGKIYILVENELVGEEDTKIIDTNDNIVMNCVYNGFFDLEEELEEEEYRRASNNIVSSLSVKEKNYYFSLTLNELGEADAYLKIFATEKYKYNVIYDSHHTDFFKGIKNLFEADHITKSEILQAVQYFVEGKACYIEYGTFGIAILDEDRDIVSFFDRKEV